MDMEEKYATLQEEAAAKSSRLKEVWREFQQAKEEVPHQLWHVHRYTHLYVQLSNQKADYMQEREAMEETVQGLSREVGLYQLVMDTFIPEQYQQLIHSHATWNEDTGEWHLVSSLTFILIH